MGSKVCNSCGVDKDTTQFYKNKNTKDGLTWECKACAYSRKKKHRDAFLKANDGLDIGEATPEKKCRKCKIVKPWTQFNKNGSNRDGLSTWCRECHTTWVRDNKKYREYLLRRYGLTEVTYNSMLAAQENKCAICGIVLAEPCVDHCHTTGKVRGILCKNCNTVLGHAHDDTRILHQAIGYLNSGGTHE